MDKKNNSSTSTIKVLYVEPLQAPQVIIINRSIKDMRKLVGGNIETANFWVDPVTLVCCADGKYRGFKPNRPIFKDNGTYDVIYGSFFVCGMDDEAYFTDLSDEAVKYYTDLFSGYEISSSNIPHAYVDFSEFDFDSYFENMVNGEAIPFS